MKNEKQVTRFCQLIVLTLIAVALLASCSTPYRHTQPVKFKHNSCGYYFNHKKHGR